MNRIMRSNCPSMSCLRRAFSTKAGLEYGSIATSVNEHVNRITSLWGLRNIKIKPSQYFEDDLTLKLAAKHLGQANADDLLKLAPESKSGKLPNAIASTRIFYEETINRDINFTDNDIWLGYSKYISYLNLSLRYRAEDFKNLIEDAKTSDAVPEFDQPAKESTATTENTAGLDKWKAALEGAENCENYTIFVFPYLRKTSKIIVDTLRKNSGLLNEADFRSLVYTCGSTGSSRLLRLMGKMLREQCAGPGTDSPIYKAESHAWPWMRTGGEGRFDCNIPLLLDALSACAVIRYSVENEHSIYDHIVQSLKTLDSKIQQLGEGGSAENEDAAELAKYDNAVLEKVLSLLMIKRNFDQLGNDQIRAFSDFVCDRLHRIRPKVLANLAFSLGHSKHLDEFWMFMISKQIQLIFNEAAEAGGRERFDMDDVTAILDAYSTAGLEDYTFYSTICSGIRDEFPAYSLHHKSVVIRSLAKVRHRDQHLLEDFMEALKKYIRELTEDARDGAPGQIAPAPWRSGAHDQLQSYRIKPIDSYIVASAIVSACDLDFRADDIDPLWKVLTLKVRDSSFDICAISWLPLATITFPVRRVDPQSAVALTEFLPVWLRHVNFTITKLRSKTYMMTIQRRQLLVRHAFNLGILPERFLNPKTRRILDDICDRNYITCKEDHTPESSTFHLEVCACLRALGVTHQREINVVPFVMDVVIPPEKAGCIKSSVTAEAERESDLARAGNLGPEGDLGAFPLKYTRNSPNHRKHKEEIYTAGPGA